MTFTAAVPTADRIASLKAAAVACGCMVRVRKLSGSLRNAVRVVLTSGDFAALRDAAVMVDAVSTSGTAATNPDFRYAFDGTQINLYFRD
jgi:hypothetical protein